jgi:hypothetical protein
MQSLLDCQHIVENVDMPKIFSFLTSEKNKIRISITFKKHIVHILKPPNVT